MRAGSARCWHERIPVHGRLRQVPVAGLPPRLRHRGAEPGAGVELAVERQAGCASTPGDAVMMARHKRLLMVLGIIAGVGLAATLALTAFRDNVMLYYDPTAIASRPPKQDERFRLGGMVEKGTLKKTPGTLDVEFLVTDFKHTVPVRYSGMLPDLFRE